MGSKSENRFSQALSCPGSIWGFLDWVGSFPEVNIWPGGMDGCAAGVAGSAGVGNSAGAGGSSSLSKPGIANCIKDD